MFDLMPRKKRGSRDIARFRGEINNLFNRFFDLEFSATREFFRKDAFFPSLDVSEGKKEITVKAQIPEQVWRSVKNHGVDRKISIRPHSIKISSNWLPTSFAEDFRNCIVIFQKS